MSVELDQLEQRVKAITTVIGSAVVLIQGLADRVRATAGDATKANALAAELDTDATDLGNAITANTTP